MSIRVPFLSSMSTLVAFCWRCRLEKCRCADSDLHISPLAHRSFSHLHTLKLLRFFRALTLLAQQSRYSVGKKKELLNKSIVRMCDSDGGPTWAVMTSLLFFSPPFFLTLTVSAHNWSCSFFFLCSFGRLRNCGIPWGTSVLKLKLFLRLLLVFGKEKRIWGS